MEDSAQLDYYKRLKSDFIIVNIVAGVAIIILFTVMMMQRYGIFVGIPCGIHEIFHVYCPGCGGTRALFAFLHGHIFQSIYYNPAVFFGALLILYYESTVLLTLVKRNGKIYYYQKTGLVYAYLFILLIYAIVRDYLLVGMGIDMIGDFL